MIDRQLDILKFLERMGLPFPLYFEVGAQEVWIVDVEGKVSFFSTGNEQFPQRRLIPEAPESI